MKGEMMNREEFNRLAKKAGITRWHADLEKDVVDYGVFEFAKLVEQATLERAAKVCEDAKADVWGYHEEGIKSTAFNTCDNLACSIRALNDSHE